jgi:Predicted transcriptional regulator
MKLKGYTATRIYAETNISRSTLSGLSKNSTKMIQIDTLNSLCNFLEITPSEFFSYTPLEFKVKTVLSGGGFYCKEDNFGLWNLKSLTDVTNGTIYAFAYIKNEKKKVFELPIQSRILEKYPNTISTTIAKDDGYNSLKSFIQMNKSLTLVAKYINLYMNHAKTFYLNPYWEAQRNWI